MIITIIVVTLNKSFLFLLTDKWDLFIFHSSFRQRPGMQKNWVQLSVKRNLRTTAGVGQTVFFITVFMQSEILWNVQRSPNVLNVIQTHRSTSWELPECVVLNSPVVVTVCRLRAHGHWEPIGSCTWASSPQLLSWHGTPAPRSLHFHGHALQPHYSDCWRWSGVPTPSSCHQRVT